MKPIAKLGTEPRLKKRREMSSQAPVSSDPIQLRAVTIKPGRLICSVIVPEERFRYTNPKIAAFSIASYPELPHHACVNEVGPSFSAVIERTSIPHLLEHVAISEQTRSAVARDAEFVGTTEWVDEESGEARIELSFLDDLEALRAFNKATRFLNNAVITCLA